MKNKIYLVPLFLIIVLGAFLRFYRLGSVPSGVYVDEAAIGYNSYSLLLTGKDEYKMAFPVFLRSFGAFSSPLYVYVSTIPIWIFGLSSFSVRFLSAFAGVLTIPFIYLILTKFGFYKIKYAPILGTLIFTISPWHIFFSRAAFEVNLGLLLVSFAVYLLMLARNNQKLFVLGVTVLAVTTYAYHAFRLIPFLLVPIYSLLLYRQKKLSIKTIIYSVIIFFILSIPQILLLNTPAFGSRAAGLFYEGTIITQAGKIHLPVFISIPLAFSREFLSQFTAYFSPKNIFLLGDSDFQRSIPEVGLYYSWILPFYLIGFIAFFRNLNKSNYIFLGLMLICFTVPAALARDPFSSLRALPLIIPFSVIITKGIDALAAKLGSKFVTFGLLFLSLFALLFLWRGYFVLFPQERALAWNYGYKQLSEEIKDTSRHFVIDTSRVKPPHILLSFYLKVPPREYQKFSQNKIMKGYYSDLDFDTYYSLNNFETRPIDWEKDVYKDQILVGDVLAISEEQIKEHFLEEVFKIYDPLDQLVFLGVRTNREQKCNSIGANRALCDKQ